jgi:hypothetical protein
MRCEGFVQCMLDGMRRPFIMAGDKNNTA